MSSNVDNDKAVARMPVLSLRSVLESTAFAEAAA